MIFPRSPEEVKLNSTAAQKAMLDILLNHSKLWEFLRGQVENLTVSRPHFS